MSDAEQKQAEEEFTSSQFTELREAYKTAKKELKELRAYREDAEPKVRRAVLKEAGFDPESPQAKALLKLHDGDLDAEALKATAEEYGIAGVPVEDADERPSLSPEDKQAISSTARGAQLAAVGAPASPQTAQERYREAEASGNFSEMLAAQEEIAREWRQQQRSA